MAPQFQTPASVQVQFLQRTVPSASVSPGVQAGHTRFVQVHFPSASQLQVLHRSPAGLMSPIAQARQVFGGVSVKAICPLASAQVTVLQPSKSLWTPILQAWSQMLCVQFQVPALSQLQVLQASFATRFSSGLHLPTGM
jgi:hypothetical protein